MSDGLLSQDEIDALLGPAPEGFPAPPGFGDGSAPAGAPCASNLELALDIPLRVRVELGRARLSIPELLELGVGSVVELDKEAGEPVEVYVGGKLIAEGEVVTIGDRFGVRILRLIGRPQHESGLP